MNPSRRDVLATFLGASFAAVACRRTPPSPSLTGELLGPDHERGHRIREPELRLRLAGNVPITRVRVAIVGGGPSGLSAAWRLTRAGMNDFTILELEDLPGGTSRAGESTVTRYPWGAHYVPVPSGEARALNVLLDELGIVEGREEDGTPIVAEHVLCRAPEERLFYRGTWYEGLYLHAGASAAELAQFRAFKKELLRWQKWRDAQGRRAFVIPGYRASDDPEVMALDAITMDAWMRERKFDSPRLRWLVDYACRDDYALSVTDASAWAGIFYFVSRMGDDGQSSELMTWPDGNGHLVRHLASVAGTRVQLGVTVADVAASDDGIVLGVIDRDGTARKIIAERAIVATPRFVARKIVAPLRDQAEDPRAFDYGAWAVANLHLRGRPNAYGVPFAWDNVLYDSPSLGYVSATHQTGRDHGPTVWTWYYALTDPGKQAREKLLHATHREWADVAYSDLSRAHRDLGEHLDRIDVFRWGHAMTRPIVGARTALARVAPHNPIGAIHFAHTDLSGIALFEEAHDHGVRAAEEVLGALQINVPSIR
jgi:phytoene dehydrogenase-like protein